MDIELEGSWAWNSLEDNGANYSTLLLLTKGCLYLNVGSVTLSLALSPALSCPVTGFSEFMRVFFLFTRHSVYTRRDGCDMEIKL